MAEDKNLPREASVSFGKYGHRGKNWRDDLGEEEEQRKEKRRQALLEALSDFFTKRDKGEKALLK